MELSSEYMARLAHFLLDITSVKTSDIGRAPGGGVCRESRVCGRGRALTCHAFVLKVGPTENGRFHVSGQCVPPFIFESQDRLSPSWAVATI